MCRRSRKRWRSVMRPVRAARSFSGGALTPRCTRRSNASGSRSPAIRAPMMAWRRPRHTLKGRQDGNAVDRAGLRRKLLKAQAEAGDIVLLFADESEALIPGALISDRYVPNRAFRMR